MVVISLAYSPDAVTVISQVPQNYWTNLRPVTGAVQPDQYRREQRVVSKKSYQDSRK